jgi:hypothetical protein
MTILQTYGVTPAVISARVQGVAIGPSTVPSTDTVADMIDEAAEELQTECDNVGIETAGLTSTIAPYRQLRQLLIYLVCYRVLLQRDRGQEGIANPFLVAYREALANIRQRPARVAGPQTAPDSVRSPSIEPDLTSAANTRWITPPGRIINGGL